MVQAGAESDDLAVDPQDPTGRWVNEGGTVIDLACYSDGRLGGTIRFAADGTKYKPYQIRGTCIVRSDGRSGIVGTVPGWPHPAAVTVWCGEFDREGKILTTDLLMAVGSAPALDFETATGGTVFHRAVGRQRTA